jgi:hypothetical protein
VEAQFEFDHEEPHGQKEQVEGVEEISLQNRGGLEELANEVRRGLLHPLSQSRWEEEEGLDLLQNNPNESFHPGRV